MSDPTPPAAFSTTHPRRSLLSGKRVLLALAVVVAVVMGAGWMALRFSTSVMDEQPPLSWAQRADWPHRPVRETTLRASGVRTLIAGAAWRELSLSVPPNEAQAVAELAALARSEAFRNEATRRRLEAIGDAHPDVFYASYLLGSWHRLHGDQQEAAAWYERAFADAPGALQQRYVTVDYQALPRMPVGSLEVVCYRADGEAVDNTLRLAYPALVTDARGYVAVPVYKSVHHIARRDEPADLVTHHSEPEVFQFPGRIGTLPSALVEQHP